MPQQLHPTHAKCIRSILVGLPMSAEVQCVLADRGIRFLMLTIDSDTMTSLITAKGHELIPVEDFASGPVVGRLDQMAFLGSAEAVFCPLSA